jgi:DNA repair protein RecO (recombination protein O)
MPGYRLGVAYGERQRSVGPYRDEAIVLRTYKLGEADRIVVLYTAGNGKVRAVAKGVRKAKSRFGSRLEPTSHIAVQLYKGRGELDTITQAESLDAFRALRGDLDRLAAGSAMVEVIDQLGLEREADLGLFQMLLGALRTLEANDHPLVVPAFFLKALAHEGVRPEVDQCVSCGGDGPLVAFSVALGGLLCGACRRGRMVSAEALRLLKGVLNGRLGSLLAEPPSPAGAEVAAIATEAMEHHLERRVRSLSVVPH